MKYEAYWISPEGNILPVPKHHINLVIEYPQKFGLSLDYIKKVYASFNETLGSEGYARNKIVKDLIDNHGWVRIRYTPRRYMWTVELDKLTNKYKDMLWEFFTLLTGNRIFKKQPIDELKPIYEVRIMEHHGNKMHNLDMEEALKFKHIFESHFHNEGEAIPTTIENYEPNNFKRLF